MELIVGVQQSFGVTFFLIIDFSLKQYNINSIICATSTLESTHDSSKIEVMIAAQQQQSYRDVLALFWLFP